MTLLLDTNVVSELRKPVARMSAQVRAWAAGFTSMGVSLLNPFDQV